jgi:hypothetical protein
VSGSPLSRRRLLSAAGLTATVASVGWVAGCRFDPPTATTPNASPTPDPDAAVVDAARAELSGLIGALSTSSGTATLVSCHRAQLAALGGKPPATTTRTRPLAPAARVARERRAVARFTHWAVTCTDGDLARVLASIAAGIAMQPLLQEAT